MGRLIKSFAIGVFLSAFLSGGAGLYAEDKDGLDKYFAMSVEELLDAEIFTAGKTAEKISEIPASVVIVTRQDIEMYGYQNLTEILENIPGLYVTDDGFAESWGVRGFWSTLPRNVVVLVNNVKQTFDVYSAGLFVNVPIETIDRLEIVRGPMSVMYGTGAFFGVINILTNQVDEEKTLNRVTVSVGSEKTKKITVRTAAKEGNFLYTFNASYFDTYGNDVPYLKMVRNLSELEFLGLPHNHTSAGQFEEKETYLNFSGTFKGFAFDVSYIRAPMEKLILLPAVSDGSEIFNKATRINIGYTKTFSDKAKFKTAFCFYSNRATMDYDIITREHYGVQNVQSSGFNAEADLFLTLNPGLDLLLGLDYRKTQDALSEYTFPAWNLNNYHFTLSDGEAIITQAIFAQLNYKLSGRLTLVAGARLEQAPEYTWELKIGSTANEDPTYSRTVTTYSYTTAEFIPRLALIYSLDEKNYLKLLYGKAISRPSFFHQVGSLGPLAKLEPETIHTFEFNYIGNISTNFSVNFSLFRNVLDKLIYRSLFVVEDVVYASNANVGEMTTNGVELTLEASPFKQLHLELSGTYQDTKDKRAGYEKIEPGYSPNFLGYIKASYFIDKDISLAVTGNYVDEMGSYYDFTQSPPARLGERVRGYFLLGANVRVRNIFGTGLFFNLRGSNLLDREALYPTTSNNSWATRGIVGKGNSFLLTMGWEF
ncbi:MAG: TonB-dependent receptor [bacterium]|nr:TonB-dependent receptor [bacterium]